MYNPLTNHITLRTGLGSIDRMETIRHEKQHQADRKVLLLSLGVALFTLAATYFNLITNTNNIIANLAGIGSPIQGLVVHVWGERRATRAERKS